MYPDWLYNIAVGKLYKLFGALGYEVADKYVTEFINNFIESVGLLFGIIVWGTVFVYDYTTGHLPTPIENRVVMDKGTEWYYSNNRVISFTNNYDKPVILSKVSLQILSCHNKEDENYKCSHVTSYNNDFSTYTKKGIEIQPHQTIKLDITFDEFFLKNYDFRGYERDIGDYDVETIPEK